MNYPVWQLTEAGGGFLIALIAVFHVYIAHFAVGGGLFIVLTEMKSHRENDPAIHDYLYRHTRFFLLLTMVAGGMSGVGIWFTIALLNPAATSLLIHNFVFGWGIEWVFFVIEISSLFIYFYTFDRLERRLHTIIGWIYFISAWMSLFIINGIIGFMLTPGEWLNNDNFWSGLFNPSFWPSLFFRTFLAIMLAGLFGCVTATNIKNTQSRHTILRYCATWLLAPFALFLCSAWWYRASLPPQLENLIFNGMPELLPYIQLFIGLSAALIFAGLLIAIRLPQYLSRSLAISMLIMGLLYMGAFEFIREGGRRPFIIRDHMYSTSILKSDMDQVRRTGVLKSGRWVKHRTITEENMSEAGAELFNLLCLPCHSIGGPFNDIKEATADFTPSGLTAYLNGMEHISPYMPPFAGTDEEKKALSHYIAHVLNGRSDEQPFVIRQAPPVTPPHFAMDSSQYVLLGWAESSMAPYIDSGDHWTIPSPGLTLRAQLILRGETPTLITDDVTLRYTRDYGSDPQSNKTASPLQGVMRQEEEGFTANFTPPSSSSDRTGYQPYPVYTLTALDSNGQELCSTKLTAMIATETGCNRCHGGNPQAANRIGLSDDTKLKVLAAHDKRSKTNLLEMATESGPINCKQCHQDNSVPDGDIEEPLNLSASIHGFHAVFFDDTDESCSWCHPSSPQGATRAFRGIHHDLGLNCTDCHGDLRSLSAGLLRSERDQGKNRATTLLARLFPNDDPQRLDTIVPRKPWLEQPDCLACHDNFSQGETAADPPSSTKEKGDLFRNRLDESGQLFCAACHNFAHTLYPEQNAYDSNRTNIQPLQYGTPPKAIGAENNCRICHTIDMEDEVHHPNMLSPPSTP